MLVRKASSGEAKRLQKQSWSEVLISERLRNYKRASELEHYDGDVRVLLRKTPQEQNHIGDCMKKTLFIFIFLFFSFSSVFAIETVAKIPKDYLNPNDYLEIKDTNYYELDSNNFYYECKPSAPGYGENPIACLSLRIITSPCKIDNEQIYNEQEKEKMQRECRIPSHKLDYINTVSWRINENGKISEYNAFKKEYDYWGSSVANFIYALDEDGNVVKYQPTRIPFKNKLLKNLPLGKLVWEPVYIFKQTQELNITVLKNNHKSVYDDDFQYELKVTPQVITKYDINGNIVSVYKKYGTSYTEEDKKVMDEKYKDAVIHKTNEILEFDAKNNLIMTHPTDDIPYLQWNDIPKYKQKIKYKFYENLPL